MAKPVNSAPNLEPLPDPESSERVGIEALRQRRRSGDSALSGVSCEVHGESLRLRGHLPNTYPRQVAQAIVAEVEGVRRVVNHIEVAVPPGGPGTGPGRAPQGEEPINIGHKTRS